ncbi:phage protein Gp27 family protein [Tateyamaria sp.]|uniref:phage protein Gp27 family protein n=1 Tax=Tateyamaria sp. TaxID=1929288 RepID=UPI003B214D3B
MPARRKIDLVPDQLRHWLQDELKSRGFADYDDVTKALNARLDAAGLNLNIGRSAVHAYGTEFRQFAVMQAQAQDEIRAFLDEASLKDEVDVTSALFQQLTTLQWRLQTTMAQKDRLPDPRGMKDLTTALNSLIRSTGLRRSILAGAGERAEKAAVSAGLSPKTSALLRARVEGAGDTA